MSESAEAPKGLMQKILDVVEKVGNKVPHPVVLFLSLIVIVIVLSHLFYLLGTRVSVEVIAPEVNLSPEKSLDSYPYSSELSKPHKPEMKTIEVRSLLTTEGIRFMYVSMIPSFMSFTGLGLIIVAMIGVGVAEQAGLVTP
jgi:aminobenzoyl-glutamate transport protein